MDSRPLLFKTVRSDLSPLGFIVPYEQIPSIPVLLDYQYVAASSLLGSITKKFVPTDPLVLDHTRKTALCLFRSMNKVSGDVVPDAYLSREMRRTAESDFAQCYDWQDLLANHGIVVGAGSSVGSRGQNSLFEKLFVNDLTTTNPFLYGEYIRYIRSHDTFWYAERNRRALTGRPFVLVNSSTTSTVPKNDRIDRTICTEPSLNMIFQRALGEHINTVLKRVYGYDPALQPDRNRARACLGSIHDSMGTIDLSSASDTVSLQLVRSVLPTWVVAAIDDCRCKYTSIDGELVELDMCSTMGNGFTFPLQTYLFSLLTRVLCRLRNEKFVKYDNPLSMFGVFGDDIIVPSNLYEPMIASLSALGFIPNVGKSFNHGYFRESCGTDWYNGHNVRGVYCKSLATINDRFSLLNRLMRFCASHGLVLKNTTLALRGSGKGWLKHIVPTDMADDSGIKVPASFAHSRRTRFGTYRYRCFSPSRLVFKIWVRDELIRSHYNPFGIAIASTASNVALGVDRRSTHSSYRLCRGHAPFWERDCDFSRFGLTLRGWETSFMLDDWCLH